jgi:hypothetical protein
MDAVYIIHLDGMTGRHTALSARFAEKETTAVSAATLLRLADDIKGGDSNLPKWPFPPPILWPATDLRTVPPSMEEAFKGNIASWVAVLQNALDKGYGDILVCEDDVLWAADLAARYDAVFADLPKDWQFFALGARPAGGPTVIERLTERLVRVRAICGTYAVGVSGATIKPLLAFLTDTPDQTLGMSIRGFIAANESPSFIASPPLCGHAAGVSTIWGTYPRDFWWPEGDK